MVSSALLPSSLSVLPHDRFKLFTTRLAIDQQYSIQGLDMRSDPLELNGVSFEIASSLRCCSDAPMGVVLVLADPPNAGEEVLVYREVPGLYHIAQKNDHGFFEHRARAEDCPLRIPRGLLRPVIHSNLFWENLARLMARV